MSKKGWIIGCSGCLGVVLIVAIVAGVFIYNGVNQLGAEMSKSASAVFGEKVPSGYMPIGFTVPTKDASTPNAKPQTFAMLMNMATGRVAMAFDTTVKPEEAELLKSANPEQVQTLLETYMSQSQSSGNEVRGIEKIEPSTITMKGKPYPAYRLIGKSRGGKYTPMIGTILLYPADRIVFLIMVDGSEQTMAADTDFTSAFKKMEPELADIIQQTALAKNLQEPASIDTTEEEEM
jgi:hypothetical protein